MQIVQLNLFQPDGTRIWNREILGLNAGSATNPKPITMYGERFLVKGAISHSGQSTNSGHYVAWIIEGSFVSLFVSFHHFDSLYYSDSNWICVDDLAPAPSKIQQQLPRAMKNIHMLILERQR